MTEITKKIEQLHVYPELNGVQNVIRGVVFSITFTRDGVSSSGAVDAILDVNDLSQFVSITELTDEQIIEWAYQKAGGGILLQQLQSFHEEQIDRTLKLQGTVVFTKGTRPIPQEVTRFQALAALMQADLLDDIENYMALTEADSFTKLAWKEAATFSRNSPIVAAIGLLVGLTDSQIDDLFIFANSIGA